MNKELRKSLAEGEVEGGGDVERDVPLFTPFRAGEASLLRRPRALFRVWIVLRVALKILVMSAILF